MVERNGSSIVTSTLYMNLPASGNLSIEGVQAAMASGLSLISDGVDIPMMKQSIPPIPDTAPITMLTAILRRTKAEEEIMEKKNLAEKEKIRISKQTIFEEYRLEIEWADDEVALNKILAKVESNDDITEELRLQLIDRIQSRLSEFELDRIDFDKLAKITDSNNVNTSNFNPIRRLGGRGK